MKCPMCRTKTMKRHTVKGTAVKVDACGSCCGIWFDAEELERAVDVAAKALTVPSKTQPISRICPRCAEVLYQCKYPQTYVAIDMCKSCGGLWLERGELKEIRVVRARLKKKGILEEKAPVTGVKGSLLGLIDSAISTIWEDMTHAEFRQGIVRTHEVQDSDLE